MQNLILIDIFYKRSYIQVGLSNTEYYSPRGEP